MLDDRREKRRLKVRDEVLVNIHKRDVSAPIVGFLVEISENGLKILLEAGDRQALGLGTVIEQLTFVTERGDPEPVEHLLVKRLDTDIQLRPQVWLEATGRRTRAKLWRFMTALALPDKRYTTRIDVGHHVPKIPARGEYSEPARMERLHWLEGEAGMKLPYFESTKLRADRLTGNIENMIGAVEVPVGLAGPLWIRGTKVKGYIYAPFATTEGALVASVTRGAKAITVSGGCTTRVIQQRMQRAPLFVLSDMHGALLFNNWVLDHLPEIREQVGKVSQHARLVSVEPFLLGNMVHVRFQYETGDAAGQNMTTATTWRASNWIMKQLEGYPEIVFENFLIEANMSGDKKVNFQSFISGRGVRVTAECFLSREALQKVLKVTPEQITRCNAGFMAGSVQVGMVGYNINVANTIGGIFAATGQDIASVHESGLGQLHIQGVDDGIYASMLLPSLIIGTVGGGTHLPGQRALLETMGCAGPGKVARLAEIIAGFALALDLSTLSAIATGQFATAHERLGRNRPVEWFKRSDLSPAFFEKMLQTAYWDDELRVQKVEDVDLEMGSSIITELTARKIDKFVGLVPMRIHFRSSDGAKQADVLAKVKPLDQEVVLMMNSMAAMCEARLAKAYSQFRDQTGFNGCHVRELAIYQQTDPRFRRNVPTVYGTHRDDAREAFVVVMEKLDDVELINTADDVSGWTRAHVEAAIRGIGEVHSVWMGRESELTKQPWLGFCPSAKSMAEMRPLWEHLGVHANHEFPSWWRQDELERYRELVRTIPAWWPEIERMPRTLIHNDFNPRNICLRREGENLRLCAYDWELATMHLPQHDVAELLAFVLPEDFDAADVENYVDLHREVVEAHSGVVLDPADWMLGFHLAVRDLVVNRFALYLMAHTFRHYRFLWRVVKTARKLLEIEVGVTGSQLGSK